MARPIVPHPVARYDDLDHSGPVPLGWRRTRTGKVKRRNILWRVRRFLVAGVAMAVLAASGIGASFWTSVALPRAAPTPQASYLCDATVVTGCGREKAFAELAVPEAGESVSYDEIPEDMVFALVAAEDKDFFSHRGVAPQGIARAIWHDVRSDSNARQGGSTLTQQLMKVMSTDDSPTFSRKVKEAVQAMKMEQEWTKREILERYFNSVYFGRGSTGIVAAVRAYFGRDKKVKEIGLAEAAYLAAVIREPEYVDANRAENDPLREKQRTYATGRRKDVLNAMLEQGYITAEKRDEVAVMGWDYVIPDEQSGRSRYYQYEDIGARPWTSYVTWWLKQNLNISEERLKREGLRVYTSMDPDLQAKAYAAVDEVLPRERFLPGSPEASLASLDDQGYLRAMVGSRNPRSIGLNLAVCNGGCNGRQPGSSFKPVVLAQYLSNGGRLDKLFDNDKSLPVKNETPIDNVGNEYTPEPVDLVAATAHSYNVVYARVMEEIGDNKKVMTMAKRLGNMQDSDFLPYASGGPRLGLGDPVNATPLEMATIYSTFANRGTRIDPSPVVKVTDALGTPIWPEKETQEKRREAVLNADVADQVNFVLKGVTETKGATGYDNARVPGQTVAGKTGSQALEDPANKKKKENSDAWFVGYTCKLTAAVWMGRVDGNTAIGEVEGVQPVNGGTLPAKIFSRYMTAATADRSSCPFDRPASAIPTTTLPPATAAPPWWARPRPTDGDDDDQGRDRTSSTRRFGLPTFTLPSTTDRDDRTTTTRRIGPSQPTTTEDTVRPRPGQANVAGVP